MSDQCDPEVYDHGEHIMTIADLPSAEIEKWVVKVSKESGQRVDWHYVGGRACIRYVGDGAKVRKAIDDNLTEITSRTKYWRMTTDNDSVLPMSIIKGHEG